VKGGPKISETPAIDILRKAELVTQLPDWAEILLPVQSPTAAAQQSYLWSQIHVRRSYSAKNMWFHFRSRFPTIQASSELFDKTGISSDLVTRWLTWPLPFLRIALENNPFGLALICIKVDLNFQKVKLIVAPYFF
jgi:hypothetical protein